MKLMIRSYSNLLLSVHKVTQANEGKKTPGIDNQVALKPKERVNLVKKMGEYSIGKVRPTKKYKYPSCAQSLFNREDIETHHIILG